MIISLNQVIRPEYLGFNLKTTKERVGNLPLRALETPERIAKNRAYLDRMSEFNRGFLQERIFNTDVGGQTDGDDMRDTDYAERQTKVMRAVARLRVIIDGEKGMGTGFMVAPTVLMTNHHVIPTMDVAATGQVDFGYEYDAYRREKTPFVFQLDPSIFVTSEELDFTLVGVSPVTLRGEKLLEQFGYLPLDPQPAKVLLKDYLSIIQHPGGKRKKVAFRNNQLIKITADHLWYVTDTDRGSSGAPVFNDAWEVVGLHHTGVVNQNEAGQYLKKDGTVWDGRSYVDDSELDWIANEAVRVSSIVQVLEEQFSQQPGVAEVLAAHTANPRSTGPKYMARNTGTHSSTPTTSFSMDQQPYNIFMPITVVIGNGSAAHAPMPVASPAPRYPGRADAPLPADKVDGTRSKPGPDAPEKLLVEKFTGSYTGRAGYVPTFLDGFDLPVPSPTQEEALGGILQWGNKQDVLPYTNFSVLMSRDWKLALVTACNVDGTQEHREIGREGNKWYYDTRLKKEDHFYDKLAGYYGSQTMNHGHLVRRQDPVWGNDAQQANDDTFHLTNSAPQAGSLNQKRWLDLENHVVSQAWNEDKKITVFTAPILLASPGNLGRQWFGDYKGTHIPMAFWKVVVYVKDAKLRCASFIMDQVLDVRALELDYGATDNAQVRQSQVALATLEKLTGLKFDEALHAPDADAFASVSRLVGQEAAVARGFEAHVIATTTDVVL